VSLASTQEEPPVSKALTRSWKVEVKTYGDQEWASNGLRFRTERDATLYAEDLYSRWMAVRETQVVASDDEPTQPESEGR
jgi:hypothetical protein